MNEDKLKKEIYSIIDSFLVEAKRDGIEQDDLLAQVKSFKEGHQVGGDEERERISDLLIQSMPDDAENLSTLTRWQAKYTIENFLKHLGE